MRQTRKVVLMCDDLDGEGHEGDCSVILPAQAGADAGKRLVIPKEGRR
jgi:hypothetical protein